ncbi:MAG: manganese efflux pump [Oscillospiraceae bacterium]|nr:manganese efflux pump [Oscillospiraceae bacterium]
MEWSIAFFFNSILFGFGLAMDAFSVSMANGLNEPNMPPHRMCRIAGTFAAFQIAMPLLGWLGVHTIAAAFSAVHRYIPWIAFLLLLWIGGNMLRDGLRRKVEDSVPAVGWRALLVQGVATSIDALSVGFTIADYHAAAALTESLIIGAVTFAVCTVGLVIGKRFGTILSGKATVLGGVILIAIGAEILLRSLLGA